jgi:hypothetical protein
MAGTALETKATGADGSDLAALRLEFNKVITDLETLRAAIDTIADQLDADATVTDTDYAANAAVTTAAAMTAAVVNATG